MARLLGCFLFLLTALPSQAQLSGFDDPTVWVSVSSGFFPWTSTVLELGERDNVVSSFSVSVASRRWMLQGGVQVSGYLDADIDIAGILDPISGPGNDREAPSTYRSVYAIGGPWTTSRWFMAGAAVGPAVTWGARRRAEFICGPGDICVLPSIYESERYLNPGLAGSVQGFVRLDGRVWIGGETMAVVNRSSSHLVTRFAVRVDLVRPDR